MLTNYGELKTEVARQLDRSDLTAEIPLYIRLAEDAMYNGFTLGGVVFSGLECEDNEFVASYDNANWRIDGHSDQSLSDGIAHNLPPNYKRMTLVTWNGLPLSNVSNQELQQRLVKEYDQEPCAFAFAGRKIAFSSAIDTDPSTWEDTDSLIFTYYGTESLDSIPTYQVATNPVESPVAEDTTPQDLSQTDDNTTRLFQRNPVLYLHGALYFGNLLLKYNEDAQKFGALFLNALKTINRASKISRYSGSTSTVASAYGD